MALFPSPVVRRSGFPLAPFDKGIERLKVDYVTFVT